jgi:hypothetical protein
MFGTNAAPNAKLDVNGAIRLQLTNQIRFGGNGASDYGNMINESLTPGALQFRSANLTNNQSFIMNLETVANTIEFSTLGTTDTLALHTSFAQFTVNGNTSLGGSADVGTADGVDFALDIDGQARIAAGSRLYFGGSQGGTNDGTATIQRGTSSLGSMRFSSRNGTNNETLEIDLESTANEIGFNSTTGAVASFDMLLKTTQGRKKTVTRQTVASYSLLTTDEEVFYNTDTQASIALLPAGTQGQHYRIVNTGSSGNSLTVTPNGTDHLLGANSNFTLADGEALVITYDTTDGWY